VNTNVNRVALCLICIVSLVHGQTCASDLPGLWSSRQATKEMLDHFGPHATSAVIVHSLDEKERLVSIAPRRALVPASTLKLFTSVTALETLGESFRFETKFFLDGNSAGQQTHKSLVIMGCGSPSFADGGFSRKSSAEEILDKLILALERSGITRISGDIIAVDGFLDDSSLPRFAVWEDLGNYYGAVTSGLAFNRNRYELYLASPKNPGQACRVLGTNPPWTGIAKFDCRVKAGALGSGDQAHIFGAPGQPSRRIVGTIPPGRKRFTIKGSLPNPALACAHWFRTALIRRGIGVVGKARATAKHPLSASSKQILIHRSAPLADILKVVNKNSSNVYAEQILKIIGKHHRGLGSSSAGVARCKSVMEELGVSLAGCELKDGSGLSRYNLVTANALAQLLVKATKRPWGDTLLASLAKVGKDKSLTRRFSSSQLRGRLRAKTGYQERVWALAGYLDSKHHGRLSVVVLVNFGPRSTRTINAACQKWLEELVELR